MKGQTDLMVFLMKIISTAWIVIIVLAAIFSLLQYNITMTESSLERKIIIHGDSLLAADCIAVKSGGYSVKGLLDATKLSGLGNTIPCFTYPFYNNYYVKIYDNNNDPIVINGKSLEFGDNGVPSKSSALTSTFPAAIKYTDSDIRPVLIDISMV